MDPGLGTPIIYEVIRQMMKPKEKGRKPIGFRVEEDGTEERGDLLEL